MKKTTTLFLISLIIMSVTLGTIQNPVKAEQNQEYESPSETMVVNKNSSKSVIFEENNITMNHTRKTYYHRLKISVNNEQELFNISEADKQYTCNISNKEFRLNPINNSTEVENFNNITDIEVEVFSDKFIVYKGEMIRGEKIRVNNTVFKLGLREDSITPSVMISKIVNDHLETQTIEEVDFGEPIEYRNKSIMITTYDDPTGYAIIKTSGKPDKLIEPTRKSVVNKEFSNNTQPQTNESNQTNTSLNLEKMNMTEKSLGNTLETIYRNYPKIAIDLENTGKFNEYIEKSTMNIEELHQVIGQNNETDPNKIENITKLQTTLENREEQIDNLKKLNNKLETQLNITKANVEELKQRINELEQENKELRQKIEELKENPFIRNIKSIGKFVTGFSPYIIFIEGGIITLLLGLLLPGAVNKKIEQRHKNMIQLKNHLTELGLNKEMEQNLIDEEISGKILDIIKVTYKEMNGTDKITREDIKQINMQEFTKALNTKWKGLNNTMKKKVIKNLLKLQATYKNKTINNIEEKMKELDIDTILEEGENK